MATYLQLFSVTFNHDFYMDGKTSDFTITPSAKTAKLMKGLKLIFRPGTSGFRVLFLQDDNTLMPKHDLTQSTLTFQMVLNNPLLLNFTELDIGYRKTVIDRYDNSDGLGVLKKTSETLSDADKIADVFANIEISNIGNTGETYPLEYKIDFSAMTRYWEYYVVYPDDDLTNITYRLKDEEIDFDDVRYPEVEFEDAEEAIVGEEIYAMYFKSKLKVKTYEEAKQKIELQKATKKNPKNKDFDTLLEHTPNPEIKNLNSTVYVYI